MNELERADSLLGDRDALDGAFAERGYLFFRGVLDTDAVARVRDGLVDYLVEQGCAVAGAEPPTSTGTDTAGLGAHPPDLHRRRLWEGLAADPSVQALAAAVLGPSPLSIPIAQYQFKSPVATGTPWTHCHQDHFYNPGLHFRTFWIPLVAVDEPLGGLALAAGCHTGGYLHDTSRADVLLDHTALPVEAWRRADYEPGDVVVFHGRTPHLGLPNVDPARLRLSVDIRFQAADAPAPVIGTVEAVDGADVTVLDTGGRSTVVTIEPGTVVRTDMAESTGPSALVGRRVICALEDGHAVLLRSVA
jgi:ectoine hydroxylase-related dioxygenase (phytanoyl-CoA dioxygenase family)